MATEWLDSRPDDGVRWLLVRAGTRRIDRDAAARGRIRWTGDYWQPVGGWGAYESARLFTTWAAVPVAARGESVEWVQVFVNVDPVEAGA